MYDRNKNLKKVPVHFLDYDFLINMLYIYDYQNVSLFQQQNYWCVFISFNGSTFKFKPNVVIICGFFFRTPHSARELLMENPPKLSDEVLQRLLSEAQTALPSRLSTLREEDEDG